MAELISSIAVRRYGFEQDGVALSSLILPNVERSLQKRYRFTVVMNGQAPPTFEAPTVNPVPTVIMQGGSWTSPSGQTVAVPSVLFGSKSVVVTLGAESELIDAFWRDLRDAIGEFKTSTGRDLIGEVLDIKDASELVVRLDFAHEQLLAPWFVGETRGISGQGEGSAVVPAVELAVVDRDFLYPGDPIAQNMGAYATWHLSPRAGASLDRHMYYSVAPLSTSVHLAYLENLERASAGAGGR